jgi:hypothetical protein
MSRSSEIRYDERSPLITEILFNGTKITILYETSHSASGSQSEKKRNLILQSTNPVVIYESMGVSTERVDKFHIFAQTGIDEKQQYQNYLDISRQNNIPLWKVDLTAQDQGRFNIALNAELFSYYGLSTTCLLAYLFNLLLHGAENMPPIINAAVSTITSVAFCSELPELLLDDKVKIPDSSKQLLKDLIRSIDNINILAFPTIKRLRNVIWAIKIHHLIDLNNQKIANQVLDVFMICATGHTGLERNLKLKDQELLNYLEKLLKLLKTVIKYYISIESLYQIKKYNPDSRKIEIIEVPQIKTIVEKIFKQDSEE